MTAVARHHEDVHERLINRSIETDQGCVDKQRGGGASSDEGGTGEGERPGSTLKTSCRSTRLVWLGPPGDPKWKSGLARSPICNRAASAHSHRAETQPRNCKGRPCARSTQKSRVSVCTRVESCLVVYFNSE